MAVLPLGCAPLSLMPPLFAPLSCCDKAALLLALLFQFSELRPGIGAFTSVPAVPTRIVGRCPPCRNSAPGDAGSRGGCRTDSFPGPRLIGPWVAAPRLRCSITLRVGLAVAVVAPVMGAVEAEKEDGATDPCVPVVDATAVVAAAASAAGSNAVSAAPLLMPLIASAVVEVSCGCPGEAWELRIAL